MTATLTRRDFTRIASAAAAIMFTPAQVRARALAPLFDFAIAGGWYYDLTRCRDLLALGERLRLAAEPGNPHDPFAVVVSRADGAKLGYLPRCANSPVSLLLRDGAAIEAKIVGWLGQKDALEGAPPLAFTSFAAGEPRIRLALVERSGAPFAIGSAERAATPTD